MEASNSLSVRIDPKGDHADERMYPAGNGNVNKGGRSDFYDDELSFGSKQIYKWEQNWVLERDLKSGIFHPRDNERSNVSNEM